MSKRSSRRNRRQKRKEKPVQMSVPALLTRGSQRFNQTDYDGAIKDWAAAQAKGDTSAELQAALAEAYFRRAYGQAHPDLADLQQAVQQAPTDARYRYHLALAHHRRGEWAQAEPFYRALLAESPPFDRAALPLAQLLLEGGKALQKDPVWARPR
jgi:tetratricopeptide (TPR) repeat protein